MLQTWNSTVNMPHEAHFLPKGTYAGYFDGQLIQQPVRAEYVEEAALAAVESDFEVIASSQAQLIVTVQQNRIALTDWYTVLVLI